MPINSPVEVTPDDHAKITHVFAQDAVANTQSISYAIHHDLATPELAAVLVEGLGDAWEAEMEPLLSNAWYMAATQFRGKIDGGEYAIDGGLAGTGAIAGEALPNNCALLVEKRTALAGRGNHGRMFIPGMLQDDEVDSKGSILGAPLTALSTAVSDWYNAILAVDHVLEVVVLHSDFIRNPDVAHDAVDDPAYRIANPDADSPATVISFGVDPKIATQRRRLR